MTQRMRIGIFLGGALLIVAMFIFIVGDLSRLFRPTGYSIYASFDTVAGLDKSATVRMSGVKIGYVKSIKLEGRHPVVDMSLEPWARVPTGSKATLSTLGLLGEKYVEILPSQDASFVQAGGSINSLASVSFDQLGLLILSIGDEVKGVSGRVQKFLGDENEFRFREMLDNLSRTSRGLNDFLQTNRDRLDESVRSASQAFQNFDRRVRDVADSLSASAKSLTSLVDTNRQGVKDNLDKIKVVLDQMNDAVKRLNDLLQKLDQGQGSLGQLINKPDFINRAEEAIGDLENAVHPLASVHASADGRVEYYPTSELWKGTLSFSVRLASGPFGWAQVVRDPWLNRFTYTLQGGMRWGALAPRLGVLESDFGLGLDIYSLDDRLRFSVDGYQFNRDPGPRLRLSSRFYPQKHLFLILGLDDLLWKKQRELFFGLGVGVE